MTSTRRDWLKLAAAFSMAGITTPSALAQTFGQESAHPNIGVAADGGPKRSSESGVGALMAWSDKLWAVTYLSEPNSGSGTGLYEIDENLDVRQRHTSNGVYANRMHHLPSNQINIGPYMIDLEGRIRVIDDLIGKRLTATMPHLHGRQNKIYILTMEGHLYEVDVNSLEATHLQNLNNELGVKGDPHWKGAFTSQGRVVCANNTYTDPWDDDGRLAEWDGETWTILEKKPFMEVQSRNGLGGVLFATGWDERSAIFKALIKGEWQTYRLPKGSQAYDQYWCTEWTRIREVETERWLMDCVGLFYELPAFAFRGRVWGIKPICRHLRIIPDFCSYRGYLVLGGNQAATAGGNFHSPQSQSGIWFGQTDDLWEMGKPSGWGGVWRDTPVVKDEPSDPFLMTGFDKKVLHLTQESLTPVNITIEVDFLGYGEWKPYKTIYLRPGEYRHHIFPDGFSAHWVRLKADDYCTATAEFFYS